MRAATALAVIGLVCPQIARAEDAPTPLSKDRNRPSIASTYGSGRFGRWFVDRFGLPAYRYAIDENKTPWARNPELAGKTDAWHQVGNDHIVANAYNHGYVQLWSQDRLYQWINYPVPTEKHYAGGYGYLNSGGRVLSTLYLDRPKSAHTERDFGVGYARHRTAVSGIDVDETVYAPFGDDPVLLHDVTIRNTSKRTMKATWFEYWDVNPMTQAMGQHRRGVLSPQYNQGTQTLSADQMPTSNDDEPLTIYAAQLNGKTAGFDTDTSAFFGNGSRAVPAAVKANKTSNSIAPVGSGSIANRSMFAFRSPVAIAPGGWITLRYAFGAAHRPKINGIVRRARRNSLFHSESQWLHWVPKAAFPSTGSWLSRELQWDAYMVRSGSTYEECAHHHILSQGGYYQYDNGFQGAFRDPLQHMLPMIYSEPWLAREVLRYSAQEQPPNAGAVPYGMISGCKRFDLGTADDLDFWFMWAVSEYALATRDFQFFSEKVPYSDGTVATVWDHIKLAFFHQENGIGRGPHGGYWTGATGDWSDFETEFQQMTESMLVTAQLAYAYPLLAQVADARRDHTFAAQLRAAGRTNVATLRKEWTGGGWFSRGYSGPTQMGKGAINSEPQPWAMMAGAAKPSQERKLLRNVRRYLTGVGAPGGPSKIGSAQSPAANDPGVTEHTIVPIFSSAMYVGNVWYALNGPLVWASAPVNTTFAWDEFKRNTLARHATAFPTHWDGVLSTDDVCHAWYSSPPAQCGTGLTTAYFTQILHQPAWSLFDAIKLAGLVPTKDGYRIEPHVLGRDFSFRMPLAGVARAQGVTKGYIRPERSGRIAMDVVLPRGVHTIQVWVNGHTTAATLMGGTARFILPATADKPADWAITY